MSLKAKIEAVIYASEEPVTLAQLTGLLGEEAQAELDALDTHQQRLALDDFSIPDQDALNAETLETDLPEEDAAVPSETSTPADLDETPVILSEADTQGPSEETPVILSEAEARPLRDSAESKDRDAADPSTTASPLSNPESPDAAPVLGPKAEALATKQKDRRLRDYFRSLLDQLIRDYASDTRGLEIREVAGGFRLATKPEYHDAVRGFVKSLKPPLKLSLQALETLAVIAYKQPVTAPEISEIRGVDSGGVLGSLMARKLITTAGRKQVIGRPILYKTTKDFLLRFGLKDINELPSIEEFEKMAGELNAQEEIPMDEPLNPSEKVPEGWNRVKQTEEDGGSESSLNELAAAPEPTHAHHDTPEDLMSDRSAHLEGHNREHADTHEVEPQEGRADRCPPEPKSQPAPDSQLRAEDGEASENEADEVVIDGRISGLDPDYTDDSPSAQEAAEQDQEQQSK